MELNQVDSREKIESRQLTKKVLRESLNWAKYENSEGNIEGWPFREPLPYYLGDLVNGKQIIFRFCLKLNDGSIIKGATLDISRQYMAEGSQWRDSRGKIIDEDKVVAWKQMDY